MRSFFRYLFRPAWWAMIRQYNKAWDEYVAKAIEAGEIKQDSSCWAIVGGKKVWVQNYPYGYGHPEFNEGIRPSRETIEALASALAPLKGGEG